MGIFDFGLYFSRYFIGNSWLARLVKNCLSDWSTCAAWGGEDTVDSLSCEWAPAFCQLVANTSSKLCLDANLDSYRIALSHSVLHCFNCWNTAADSATDEGSASGLFQLFKKRSVFVRRGVCDEAIDECVETFFRSFIYVILKDFFPNSNGSVLFKGFRNLFGNNFIENIIRNVIDIGKTSDYVLDLFAGGSAEKSVFKTATSERSERYSYESGSCTSRESGSKCAIMFLFWSEIFVVFECRIDRSICSSGRAVECRNGCSGCDADSLGEFAVESFDRGLCSTDSSLCCGCLDKSLGN